MGELRAARWVHEIREDGSSSSSVSCVEPEGDWCIVNRLGNLALPGTRGWNARDEEYGKAEFLALLISWLQSLGPRVIDPPGGNDLLGEGAGEWNERRLAREAGLPPLAAFAVTRPRHVPWHGCAGASLAGIEAWSEWARPLVVGTRVLGAPPGLAGACLGLARKLGLDTLALELAAGEAGWGFVACERLPEIAEGEALEALVDLAEARASQ